MWFVDCSYYAMYHSFGRCWSRSSFPHAWSDSEDDDLWLLGLQRMVCHSVTMEPMVLVTSGCFLHHSSFSGYSIWPYIYVNPHHSNPPTSVYVCITFASATGFYALTRPYRSSIKNNIDICILFLLEGLSFAFYAVMDPRSQASPILCSSVCVQYNAWKRKSAKNGGGLVSFIMWVTSGDVRWYVESRYVQTCSWEKNHGFTQI